MQRDVDELADVLFGVDLGNLDTRAVTARLTREIVSWAAARGWSTRTEARVHAADGAERAARLGFIDVVVRRGLGQQDLAIEIDSCHKSWSLDKLRHAAGGGMHAVWIRWGDESWAGVHDDVDVLQLYENRSVGSRPTLIDQLELRL
ncbi:MAG: hypothetical protein ABIP53_00775 [Candidatus Limnocylindrales bacterium]